MDLNMLENAASLILRLCAEHPELCPHNYELAWSKLLNDGTQEKHFECTICGKEAVVTQ